MADDPTQRPYRSNETLARSAPGKSPGPAQGPGSASDPLAELARLIGQNDPFSEFGRDGVRRPAAPPHPPEPASDWDTAPAGAAFIPEAPAAPPPMPAAQSFGSPNFGRQTFGGAPLAAGADLYQVENEVPGYSGAHPGTHAAGYDDDPYNPSKPQLDDEEADFYDDVQTSRRRMGVMVIAGIFALAVIGTAGAFGYRAIFGSSGTSSPPPVIKAETAPSKIVPASAKDPQSAKQITDRVNDRGMGEKLVSREEQPVDVKDKPAGVVFPQGQDPAQSSSQPALGSGIVGSDAKRVRTIVIHPDQGAPADAAPAPAPTAAPTRVTATATAPAKPAAPPPPAPRVVSNSPPAAEPEPAPAPRQATPRVAPPVQQAAAPAPSGNAPLSLSPDTPTRAAPARASAPAARTAAVTPVQTAPAAPNGGSAGGFAVQVSSQRSEAEAQAAFRSLQGKFPGQLGGKQALIQRVDLGAKGIYFRAMVGPFANGSEASELCGSLKAAGGSCIVQRN